MSAALHPQVVTVTTRHPCTAAQMAAAAGVSRRMIFLALKVQRAGCEEMHRMLRDGSLSMSLAAVLVDLFPNHDDQRVVLTEFATLPPRQWLGFAQRVSALMGPARKHPQKQPHSIHPEAGALAMRLPSHANGKCHAEKQP